MGPENGGGSCSHAWSRFYDRYEDRRRLPPLDRRRQWPALIRSAGEVGVEGAVIRGWWVAGNGLGRGTLPRGSGRLRVPGHEQHQAPPIGIAGGQRDLDPGRYLGDARGALDQRRAERVELRGPPE